jgi:hypothetical protein
MSEFVEVKTAELSGAALNWATFCAVYTSMQPTVRVTESETREIQGLVKPITFPRSVSLTYSGAYGIEHHWYPSSDWECGGPLIQKYQMDFCCEHPETIGAALCDENGMYIDDRMMFGKTHLIAACRALVAHKLGDTVSVPKELMV